MLASVIFFWQAKTEARVVGVKRTFESFTKGSAPSSSQPTGCTNGHINNGTPCYRWRRRVANVSICKDFIFLLYFLVTTIALHFFFCTLHFDLEKILGGYYSETLLSFILLHFRYSQASCFISRFHGQHTNNIYNQIYTKKQQKINK